MAKLDERKIRWIIHEKLRGRGGGGLSKWEWVKIGAGAPPIKTPEGWLAIVHGKGDKTVYSVFCVLLDLEEPWRVVRRADTPLLTPTEPYETEGFFGNVVFSNGVIEKDGKILVYYGAADETSCVTITGIDSPLRVGMYSRMSVGSPEEMPAQA